LKTWIKYILQRMLGMENYLYFFSLFIIRKLRWDKNEKDFLYFLKLLPDKGTVIDVGANLGVMSYFLAKNYSRRQVVAFEPVPCNIRNLEKIRKRFILTNLRIYPMALGDKPGELDMILPVEKSVRFHGLAHVKHESIPDHNEGEIIRCKVDTLDNFEAPQECKLVTGIKLDVENYEYFVLRGGEKLIRQQKPIIYCELWDNENRKNAISFLQEIGYRTMILQHSGLILFDPEKHRTQNFFFIPKV
jgi:FkbM family methyltransferase